MGFQILNSDNIPISLGTLDEEAAKLWQKPVKEKLYATPFDNDWSSNWFDTIGYNIHSPHEKYTSGWDNVKCSLMAVQTAGYGMLTLEQATKKLAGAFLYLAPYFQLIDYWAAKGYKPHQTVE